MSNTEIPKADIDRLVRIGNYNYALEREEQEKKLGIALWNLVELERQDTSRPYSPDKGDFFSIMQSRETQVAPKVSAFVVFMANIKFLELKKEDWLPRVNWATLKLNTFARELPHTDDEIARSEFSISPKARVPGDDPSAYRDTPHAVSAIASSQELPVPDIETTILILDKIAGEYPSAS